MPVVAVFRVATGNDDGSIQKSSTSVDRTSTALIANDINPDTTGTVTHDFQSYGLLTHDGTSGAPPPQAQPITSAKLKITAKAARTTSYFTKLSFENVGLPVIPTSPTDLRGKARTTPVEWKSGVAWADGVVFEIDLTASAQAIFNRTDYEPGNPLQVLWDFYQAGYQENNNHQAYSYNGDPAKAFRLEITYPSPATVAPPTTFEIPVATGSDDARADAEGVFSSATAFSTVGTLSGSTDHRFYERFLGLAIPRGNKIDSAVMRVRSNGTATSLLAIEARLDASLTPAAPADASFRTRAYTSARGAMVVPETVVQDSFYDIDFAPALQEMVNKAGWAESGQNIGIIVQLQNPADTTPRRHFASYESNPATAPKIIVTHSAPTVGTYTAAGSAVGSPGTASGTATTPNPAATVTGAAQGQAGTAAGAAQTPNAPATAAGIVAGQPGTASGAASTNNTPATAEGAAQGQAGTAEGQANSGEPPVYVTGAAQGGADTASGAGLTTNDPATVTGLAQGEAGSALGEGVQKFTPPLYAPFIEGEHQFLEAVDTGFILEAIDMGLFLADV